MIFEGWGIGHWRGSGYGKGLGGRTHLTIHCSVFFGLSFHDGNICEWKRVKALGVGAILLDLHIFGGDIKAKKSRGVPQVAESVYSTKLKKKSPIQAQLLTDSLRNLLKPKKSILHILLWTIV